MKVKLHISRTPKDARRFVERVLLVGSVESVAIVVGAELGTSSSALVIVGETEVLLVEIGG